MENNTFSINTATEFGGAVYAGNSPNMIIESNVADGHASTFGGVVYMSYCDNSFVNYNNFMNNSGTYGIQSEYVYFAQKLILKSDLLIKRWSCAFVDLL